MKNNTREIPEEPILSGKELTKSQYAKQLCDKITDLVDRFNEDNYNSESKFLGAAVVIVASDTEGDAISGAVNTSKILTGTQATRVTRLMKESLNEMAPS